MSVQSAVGVIRLARPFYNYPYLLWVVLGWAVAQGGARGDLGRLVGLLVAVFAACCASTALNDVLDADKDAVTAPHRPIPSGEVSKSAGVAFVSTLYVLAMLLLLVASSGSVDTWGASVGCLVLLLVLGAAYSRAKRFGLWADLLCGLAATSLLLLGAIHGGSVDERQLLLPAAFVVLFEVACNLGATISDAWADGSVGNLTVAARWGPAAAIRLALFFLLASGVVVVSGPGQRFWATMLVVAGATVSVLGARPVLRWNRTPRLRSEVSLTLRPLRLGSLGIACGAIAAHRPALAVVSGTLGAASQLLGEHAAQGWLGQRRVAAPQSEGRGA